MDFENQQMIEHFFDQRQTPHLIRQELLGSKTVVNAVWISGMDEEFAMDLLVQIALYKRAHPTILIGLLRKHFTAGDSYQRCADALIQAAEANLLDFDPEHDVFIVRFALDTKTEELIRQYQYLPPMVVPPLEVTSNRGSGYLTIIDDSLILQNNHHEGDISLDSINRFNQIPLKLNMELALTMKNSWRNLDKPKNGESFQDYQKRLKAFDTYQRSTAFTMALMVEMGNTFYLTHKVDKRGRTYCSGYNITPQGNTWSKATLELAEPELIEV